jgi:hypothetical protein
MVISPHRGEVLPDSQDFNIWLVFLLVEGRSDRTSTHISGYSAIEILLLLTSSTAITMHCINTGACSCQDVPF